MCTKMQTAVALLTLTLATIYLESVSALDVVPVHARGGIVYAAAQYAEDSSSPLGSTPEAAAAYAALHHGCAIAPLHALPPPNGTANYFVQFTDHNRGALGGVFQQRWWVDRNAWDGKTGVVLIHLAGEGPASASPTGYAREYGYSIGSLLVTLEHRFYGDSLPAPLTDRITLGQLTVENVLRDVKRFKDHIMKLYFSGPDAPREVKWVVIGGSYAGALSTWVRQQYPQDFTAAWSSSGVVNAVFDFYGFDHHIIRVLPASCTVALRRVFKAFSDVYDGPPSAREAMMENLGTPSYFTKTDTAWMLVDGAVMAVQYGHKNVFCDKVEAEVSSMPQQGGGMEVVSRYGAVLRELWGSNFTRSCYYSTECLSNASYSSQWVEGNYAWVYQCCSQLAYWQVAYPNSLRLPEITTEYFINQCRSAFGSNIFPDTFRFNTKYGGARPHVDRVVAFQASDDPWLPAGVPASLGEDYPVLVAQCSGCGHCDDLHSSSKADHPSLVVQRELIAQYLGKWLGISSWNATGHHQQTIEEVVIR